MKNLLEALGWLVQWLNAKKMEIKTEEKIEPSPITPTPEPEKKPDHLTLMCEAIRDFEGGPSDRNYRNNNPGNLRRGQWSLAIGFDNGGFAIFKSMEDGMKTLRNMITNAARGDSKVYKPTDSLVAFFKKYAPASDNNHPERYASFVAKRMDVNPFTFQIRQLL